MASATTSESPASIASASATPSAGTGSAPAPASVSKISSSAVREDFNDVRAVIHYTKAAHRLGLWESERLLIERFFSNKQARLIEAGCGAGRVSVALWELGYRRLVAFDFAEELLAQAQSLADERRARITFFHCDARRLTAHPAIATATAAITAGGGGGGKMFDGALFMFNGLMQIPGRRNRRKALRQLHAVCRPGAPLMFTTHDRDRASPAEQILWRLELKRWAAGKQDPILREFGDRYFEDVLGRTFMHLPDRAEILEDLKATGWRHTYDAMRSELAKESRAVRDFSDECRFWVSERTE
ncbi:class I SAM-dependent methyltransferase [Opitutaceae bacterium TAV4]|nr:class I SAM-dependent methyltransferase [Opitutaceae bacterium TAV4]RRJ99571.1 class I SAM-dependent methyltransferase [Opitutaceae bacterium TAV3]